MTSEINVSMPEAEPENVTSSWLEKLHRLLANLYYHDCALPEVDMLLKCINAQSPRKNCYGMLSLVHIFVMLVKHSDQFERIAHASEDFASKSLAVEFGPGDEFQNDECPMHMLVTFVIKENKLLTLETVNQLTDYVVGVILYNDIRATRVQSVKELLFELDEYHFDVSHGGHGRLLSYLGSACRKCMREDLFVACLYDCFAKIEFDEIMRREGFESMNAETIKNHFAAVILKHCVDDDDDVDCESDDDDDSHAVAIVSTSVFDDTESEARDSDLNTCAKDGEVNCLFVNDAESKI